MKFRRIRGNMRQLFHFPVSCVLTNPTTLKFTLGLHCKRTMSSNTKILTRSHNIVASKKRQKREQVKEILFDDDARREFLTGFHKRNLQKKEAGKKRAIEREKQERLEMRREKRRMLAEKAAENAAKVEGAYGGAVLDDGGDDDDDEEWKGIGSSKSRGKEREDEYSDEEQLATVTVVEDFDPSTLIHGPPPPFADPSSTTAPAAPSKPPSRQPKPQGVRVDVKTKTKPKKIRYETKAARKAEKGKQHAR
ncbi:nucleolar protein 12-domain-containing protein, partial [Amylostereum chailletii]